MPKTRKQMENAIIGEAAKQDAHLDQAAMINPETAKLLGQSDLASNMLFHHGFFPKDIVRYLISVLRDAKVPCEMGFDAELAHTPGPVSQQLKDNFKDARPFYFVSFPIEYLKKARQTLSETRYPIENTEAMEAKAEMAVIGKRIQKERVEIQRAAGYVIAAIALIIGLAGFVYLANIILQ